MQTLHLIAQIHTVVIKEFHSSAAGQQILKIDIPAHKGIQFVNLRHTGDAKGVDLIDYGLLEFLVCFFSVLLNVPCDKALFIGADLTSAVLLTFCAISAA